MLIQLLGLHGMSHWIQLSPQEKAESQRVKKSR